MAIRDINARSDVLEQYELKLKLLDDGYNKIIAGKVFVNEVLHGPQLMALLGPYTSHSSSVVATIARYWNLIQLSAGATSTQFSNREEFPYFYSSLLTDITYNSVRVGLVKRFGWKRVAILYHSDVLFDNGAQHLQTELEKASINIIARETFVTEPDLQVKTLKEKGARIIFLFGYPRIMARVFCHAYKLGMYGENYAWFGSIFTQRLWWNRFAPLTNCSAYEILQVAKGYIAFRNTNAPLLSDFNTMTAPGLTFQEFLDNYDKFTNTTRSSSDDYPNPLAYDSLWCLASALNETDNKLRQLNSSLADFKYDAKIAEIFNIAIQKTSFLGLTGPFSFSSGARVGNAYIQQFRGNISSTGLVVVGSYRSVGQVITFNESEPLIWPGGHVPFDGFITSYLEKYITIGVFVAMSILSVIGMIAALTFLYINYLHRNLRVIKMSSPRINNLILIGFILCFVAVVMFGVDSGTVNKIYLPAICTARVIKDHSLFGLTFLLFVVDLIILGVWIAIDPFTGQYEKFTSYPSKLGSNIIIQPQTMICSCQYSSIWLAIIYGYKFLLLVFGTFLAWETRSVSIAELNDSRHIGLAIYNAVIFATIGVLVGQLTQTGIDGGYIINSSFILICATSSMCLFFIPKIQLIRSSNYSILSMRTRESLRRPQSTLFQVNGGSTKRQMTGNGSQVDSLA
ncbi:uncharacterized protein TRIADDRAFT_58938 [Trichoplax adhaerens]|uniref:Gamma-aminobutyric acid type B receptor subunit 2 n=1 Tax=Trichoplax adhaerens TaxID=10228 RepID=B3S434_TRIAD|nr:hypothetical protein TRIADDRAFT_58938 [Trichoplax adhaerens]EDV22390.1 hypothetical protein TRIADDRAFT_58938 [Trichoplax adhaerens]|eukprot:XP_002114934.1 hypothetical protein TRIADDRAFT_58938 [Trichoplax adhaerens]